MFTYGRFFICVLVIVCFFVVAWNANIDPQKLFNQENVAKLKEMTFGDSQDQGQPDQQSAGFDNQSVPPTRDTEDQSVWKESKPLQQDFSNIAITDNDARPFAGSNGFANLSGNPASNSNDSTVNQSNASGEPKSTKQSISEEWERAMERVNQVAENEGSVAYQPPPSGNLDLLAKDASATELQNAGSLADVPPRQLVNKEAGKTQESSVRSSIAPAIPEIQGKNSADVASVNSKQGGDSNSGTANANWATGSKDLDQLVKQHGLNDPNAPPIPPGLDPEFFKTLPKKSDAISVVDGKQGEGNPVSSKKSQAHVANRLPVVKKLDFVGELVVVEKSRKQSQTKPIGFVKHTWSANDNLPLLAETYLGSKERYPEILQMNSEALSDPTRIPAGTILKIPVY